MELYQGCSYDKPIYGGKFPEEEGYCFESYNFKPYRNHLYGFVKSRNYNSNISIENLGAQKKDNSIKDITVVYFATKPKTGGQYIIGWYKNATVFRHFQKNLPKKTGRIFPKWNSNEVIGYHIKASIKDAILLPPEERVFKILHKSVGGPGISQLWYCNKGNKEQLKFLKDVEYYIKYRKLPKSIISKRKSSKKVLQDYKKIKETELKAMNIIKEYYYSLGYVIDDVSKDNLGYDLEAYNDNNLLYLEVKGLSSNNLFTELTPNQFQTMNDNKDNYRICIAADISTKKPIIYIFRYSYEKGCWIDQNSNKLIIKRKTGAKIWI